MLNTFDLSENCSGMPPQDTPALQEAIYRQLDEIGNTEVGLGRGYVHLGRLLLTYRERVDYESFKQFMVEISNRYNRKKTALWGYVTVAEKLLPIIDAATLEAIGISKALELQRALKKSGKTLPQEIINAASKQETTIKELRAELARAFGFAPDDNTGVWLDFGGAFLTKEERDEFFLAVRTTKAMLGLKDEVPDHIQRKAIFQAWSQEFVGTHSAEVYGPQQAENTPTVLMLQAPQENQ